jgi:hypothetical protein
MGKSSLPFALEREEARSRVTLFPALGSRHIQLWLHYNYI